MKKIFILILFLVVSCFTATKNVNTTPNGTNRFRGMFSNNLDLIPVVSAVDYATWSSNSSNAIWAIGAGNAVYLDSQDGAYYLNLTNSVGLIPNSQLYIDSPILMNNYPISNCSRIEGSGGGLLIDSGNLSLGGSDLAYTPGNLNLNSVGLQINSTGIKQFANGFFATNGVLNYATAGGFVVNSSRIGHSSVGINITSTSLDLFGGQDITNVSDVYMNSSINMLNDDGIINGLRAISNDGGGMDIAADGDMSIYASSDMFFYAGQYEFADSSDFIVRGDAQFHSFINLNNENIEGVAEIIGYNNTAIDVGDDLDMQNNNISNVNNIYAGEFIVNSNAIGIKYRQLSAKPPSLLLLGANDDGDVAGDIIIQAYQSTGGSGTDRQDGKIVLKSANGDKSGNIELITGDSADKVGHIILQTGDAGTDGADYPGDIYLRTGVDDFNDGGNIHLIPATTGKIIASNTMDLGNKPITNINKLVVNGMKTGTNQSHAGAGAGELWADSDDDYTVKLGQ